MSNAPRDARGRRFWGDDDSATPILHIDVDSFFAQVELAEDPSLAGKEIIVGGTSNHGVVTSTTYEARAKGVRAGMPMARAQLLCPETRVVPSRRGTYSEYSKCIMATLSSVTPELKQVSIDEAFPGVSGARRRLGSPTSIGCMLRARIREEVGLPVNVGVASSKFVAKIASSGAKPDGLLLIPGDRTVEFPHELPVGALWGAGAVSAKRFEEAGIDTIGDLAKLGMSRLSRIAGVANARRLHNLAWGIDRRRVAPHRDEKSIGAEQTFDEDLRTRKEVEAFLLKASRECVQRLRTHEWIVSTIVLKLRDPAFKTLTRSTTLHAPSDVGRIVFEVVKGLFEREVMPAGGVHLVGVRCKGSCSKDEGIAIILDEDGKPLASERAMNSVLSRFRRSAIAPATLIQRPDGTESLEGHATDQTGGTDLKGGVVASSDYEKQILEQMKEEFRRADPALASQMESPIEDHAPLHLSPRRIAAGVLLAIVDLIVLVAAVSLGYSLVSILLGVAGFVLVVGGVWFAISSPKGSGVPSPKKKVKCQRSSWTSFFADQERRWQERDRH